MLLLLATLVVLLLVSLAPGSPGEAGSRRGGDQLLEVGGGGHLGPGGVGADLHGDAAVLVGASRQYGKQSVWSSKLKSDYSRC